jgi:site-specific DNA-methyltransferase (adenine-specific)
MILSESPRIELIHGDCMDYMNRLKPKAFQLAIVDPPYGIGEDGLKNHSRGNITKPTLYTPKKWDSAPPNIAYFQMLINISKNVIIWGANHFIENIPKANSPCWIVWDKQNGENDFADCEMAWTNFNTAVRKYEFRWSGMLQGDMKNKEHRIHPTQKPVRLYRWLLQNYAKQSDRILDTHLGSGSSAIACYEEGFDFVGIELDKDYYDAAVKRFRQHIAQGSLF